jgi:hypothetical protein
VLPLYLFGVPREAAKPVTAPAAAKPAAVPGHVQAGQRYAFIILAAGFTLAAVIMTVISVHLLTLLRSQGLALAAAVALGTLIGPAQVGARVLEMLFGKRAHPIWSLVASAVAWACWSVRQA